MAAVSDRRQQLLSILADGFIAFQKAPRRGRKAEYEYLVDVMLADPDRVLRAMGGEYVRSEAVLDPETKQWVDDCELYKFPPMKED